MYHATAILLPDARVLVAGSDFQPSGEIYSPPYLFRGPRPVIQSAPLTVAYGADFGLQFSSSTGTNTVVLVRLSSVTHSVNMGQRYVRLVESVPTGGPVNVAAPATANVAPPGFYMLFVVDAGGVPSEASIVQVGPGLVGDLDGDGVVGILDFLALLAAWSPCPGPCPPSCPGDLDGDCTVGITDFLILLANWG